MVPSEPMASGTAPPGIGFGQRTTMAGRSLDFYRATPIRTVLPFRPALRLPNVFTR
jgi:hypothetical protein